MFRTQSYILTWTFPKGYQYTSPLKSGSRVQWYHLSLRVATWLQPEFLSWLRLVSGKLHRIQCFPMTPWKVWYMECKSSNLQSQFFSSKLRSQHLLLVWRCPTWSLWWSWVGWLSIPIFTAIGALRVLYGAWMADVLISHQGTFFVQGFYMHIKLVLWYNRRKSFSSDILIHLRTLLSWWSARLPAGSGYLLGSLATNS